MYDFKEKFPFLTLKEFKNCFKDFSYVILEKKIDRKSLKDCEFKRKIVLISLKQWISFLIYRKNSLDFSYEDISCVRKVKMIVEKNIPFFVEIPNSKNLTYLRTKILKSYCLNNQKKLEFLMSLS